VLVEREVRVVQVALVVRVVQYVPRLYLMLAQVSDEGRHKLVVQTAQVLVQ
jgi:hypothetical protein